MGNISVQCCFGYCNNFVQSMVLINVNEDQKFKYPENEEHGDDISLGCLMGCSDNSRGERKDQVDFLLT